MANATHKIKKYVDAKPHEPNPLDKKFEVTPEIESLIKESTQTERQAAIKALETLLIWDVYMAYMEQNNA